ncbi:YIEGIA family protein [Zhaonella formicivorans]|uniref:YIEGIA family protein n=1 Tax=Zhaonella formicivorans TaxID=2528593 RepID=UPI0010EF62A9|nr:YIEGIA family protein [Zhaonella formicivorans]
MDKYGLIILVSIIMGTVARLLMLRTDYRFYPGYPHGYVTHISVGFIAAALGAVAVPALAEKDFTAVTFLALAAQQFREIRNMEREALAKLEKRELVPRGLDYIEGIAKVFEARNYLVMGTSLLVSFVSYFSNYIWGIASGIAAFVIAKMLMRGETIADIATIQAARLHFEGPFLKADEIVIMNVGLKKAQEKIMRDGLAVRIIPKNDNGRLTLHDAGQRQAIIHTAAALLGTKREIGEAEWTPLARKNLDTGEVCLFIIPNEPDLDCLIEAVKRTPVLESAKRRPLATTIGKAAAD